MLCIIAAGSGLDSGLNWIMKHNVDEKQGTQFDSQLSLKYKLLSFSIQSFQYQLRKLTKLYQSASNIT